MLSFLMSVACALILLAAILTNPQPARQATAKAFCSWNLAAITVGAKQTNTINVAIQLLDARGQAIAQIVECPVYLSDNSDGSTLTATVTTSPIAVGTNGVVLSTDVSGKKVTCISNKSGLLDLNIIQTAGGTNYYLVVVCPDGSIIVSSVIAF